jgi:esterase/lipase/1-acyl-sn-glycerol-3-phosphate acyltransferase
MAIKTFGYTSFVMSFLEKILGTKFTVTGIENIPNQPTMFVANHFTRSETFFVPYIIYKKTGKQARTLADSKLYVGILGKFLNAVGTVSTKNDKRDNIIVSDLVNSRYNWIIYPEGSMIKNKNIVRDNLFISNTPYRNGPVRTGSAILALKSELYRQDIIKAYKEKDQQTLNEFKQNLDLDYHDNLKNLTTHIVPLNITYYPIRPGHNKIQDIANRIVKKIPKQIAEELEIEGNILTGAQINIHFGKPINLADYIKSKKNVISQIPIIKQETKNNFILRYFRSKLTNYFMEMIYSDTEINFDHIFIACLMYYPQEKISLLTLKKIIYYSAILINKSHNYRCNESINPRKLCQLFNDEKFHEFDDVYDLAISQGVIKENDGEILEINKNLFERNVEFHEIRLENTLHVIANEFSLLDNATAIIKRVTRINENDLTKKIFKEIYQLDSQNYLSEYAKKYDKNFSKKTDIGMPFFYDNDQQKNNSNIGIVLCHGYKSAPAEVEPLAKYLNEMGFKIYAVRLKGHGTAPDDLAQTSWQDWYDSLQIGYSALSMVCQKIIIIGFSTGGLLTLLSATKKNKFSKLSAIVSISSALKLMSITSKLAHGVELWNDVLNKFSLSKGQIQYVDDHPENPNINYSRNYISGVVQLEKLMNECDKNLELVNIPTLVIQGKNDPVVNPKSAENIYNKIKSNIKQLSMLDFNNHVIIYSDKRELVFKEIKEFFSKLNLF